MLNVTRFVTGFIILLTLSATGVSAQERELQSPPPPQLNQVEEESGESGQVTKGQFLEIPRVREGLPRSTSNETVVLSEDFEGEASGWEIEGEWEVGVPEVGPEGGYNNSERLAGTNLDGSYGNLGDERLYSPTISLEEVPENTDIILRFAEWFDLESGQDFGKVWVTTDGGGNWSQVSQRSGTGDWRLAEINLTGYEGEEIIVAFQLTSDWSTTGDGWYIDDVEVILAEPEPLSVSISSLNSQNFPGIYANVTVDTFGVGMPDLAQENFTVYENGTRQNDRFSVTPPEEGGSVRRADIVLLMDNSGSMGNEQAAVEENVFDFVDALAASEVDFALGLMRYGASENSGDPIIEDGGSLTSDAAYFKDDVWGRNITGGSTEPGYYAITEAASSFSFRPGAKRVFIIITDETPDQGGAEQGEAFDALTRDDITLFALTEDSYYGEFQPLTAATDGAFFDIYSPFDDIFDYIASQVANTYVVSYRSSNPEFDGMTRTVRVEVNYEGETASDEADYVPGDAPSIQRTPETIALEDEGRAQGTSLTIEAEITDDVAPPVQSAQLYYKATPEDNYISVEMTPTSGDVYQGVIPGEAVVTPAADYYITASDGETTSSNPSTNPGTDPHQIAILPNEPPEITHTLIKEATAGQPIDVVFSATDETNELEIVRLHYRRAGELNYQVEEQEDFANQSDFRLTIPAEYVTADGVEYYIEAVDDLDVSSTSGTKDEPHMVMPDPPLVKLSQVYVRQQEESSFSRYEPSEVVSVDKGDEIRFEGIVTDEDGNPLPERQIRVYNSFRYDPDDGDDGIQTVETGSDGTFHYPSENAISTGSEAAGVWPFWFNVRGTDRAIPFALHLHDEEYTVDKLNQQLQAEANESQFIESAYVDTSASHPFSDLAIEGKSYPTNDEDLSSSVNDDFFLYYYAAYGGPTDRQFLVSADTSAGWLKRGFDLNHDRTEKVLENLPERFEGAVPPIPTSEVAEASDLRAWSNFAWTAGAVGACFVGAISGPAGAALCVPLIGMLSNFFFETLIGKSDFAKTIFCQDNSIEDCVSLFSFGTLIAELGLGFRHLFDSPGERLLTGVQLLNSILEVPDFVGIEPVYNAQGQTKALEFELEGLEGPMTIPVTLSQRPDLIFNQVQFDDDQNPNVLNLSVESSRQIYEPGTTAQTTPSLQIGGESFSMERDNSIERQNSIEEDNQDEWPPRYTAQIPVSQLPGYTGDPETWSEPITASGASFETLWGRGAGRFCSVEEESLELTWGPPETSNAESEVQDAEERAAASSAATLDVPARAFDGQSVFVSLNVASYSQVANPEQPGLLALSPAINLDSDGHTFSEPATLTIALDSIDSEVEAERVGIYKRDEDGRWNRLNSEVDFSESTATASVGSPGYFAVLARGEGAEEEESEEIPDEVVLRQNYPNPFSQTTTISYTLPEPQHVTVKVYDVLGREVTTLVDEQQEARLHRVPFDAQELSSGIYFYRISAKDLTETEKMVVVK